MSLLDYVSKVQIGSGEEVDIKDLTILDRVYPVGSIYLSVNSTNPGSILGGTWVAWGSGRVPVGVNTSDSDFNTVEKTGGAKSHSYTPAGRNTNGSVMSHTLTSSEMPSHSHTYNETGVSEYKYVRAYIAGQDSERPITKIQQFASGITSSTGGGGGHTHGFTQPTFSGTAATMNHLQPYITCYMWKRTA